MFHRNVDRMPPCGIPRLVWKLSVGPYAVFIASSLLLCKSVIMSMSCCGNFFLRRAAWIPVIGTESYACCTSRIA